MAERGLDIKPHRKRMVEENLEDKFKDPQDPLRIAFVCSMWTTVFDVPSVSSLLLYKAILPDTRANEFSRIRAVAKFLADGIAAYTERPDVSGVLGRVQQLLDESVAAQEYVIPHSDAEALFDLAAVDWKGLEDAFK